MVFLREKVCKLPSYCWFFTNTETLRPSLARILADTKPPRPLPTITTSYPSFMDVLSALFFKYTKSTVLKTFYKTHGFCLIRKGNAFFQQDQDSDFVPNFPFQNF